MPDKIHGEYLFYYRNIIIIIWTTTYNNYHIQLVLKNMINNTHESKLRVVQNTLKDFADKAPESNSHQRQHCTTPFPKYFVIYNPMPFRNSIATHIPQTCVRRVPYWPVLLKGREGSKLGISKISSHPPSQLYTHFKTEAILNACVRAEVRLQLRHISN